MLSHAPDRSLVSTLLRWTVLVAAAVLPVLAQAQVTIAASPTPMTSTSTRMISYRHQQHMWQLPDGSTHLLLNRGLQSQTGSLTLYGTFDGGATWVQQLTIPQTNGLNVSDGQINGNDLYVAYATANNQIAMSLLRYTPSTKTWALVRTQSVAAKTGVSYSNPGLAYDRAGNLFCAYVAQDTTTLMYSLKMAVRPAGQLAWTESSQTFGPVDADSAQRSGRPLMTAAGMGMVFTVHDTMFWAERQDGWTLDTPWPISTIHVTPPPSDPDPYASHFSIVRELGGTMHLATVDKGRVVYFRYLASQQAWEPARQVSPFIGAGWVQLSIAEGKLVLMANALTNVRVWISTDSGDNFTVTHNLTHANPTPGSGLDYTAPRMETPTYSSSPIPTVQQFVEGQVQKLMFFAVPVVAP